MAKTTRNYFHIGSFFKLRLRQRIVATLMQTYSALTALKGIILIKKFNNHSV